jgi:NodT family efflux transporter outer membrane factor (OMF) lipoprotein
MLGGGPLLAVASLLTACNPHTLRRPDNAPIAAPAAFQGGKSGATAAPARWWTLFGDHKLDALEDRLLGRNLDLEQAVARAEQLGALARASGSGWWPTISANAGVSKSKSVMRFPSPAGGSQVVENENTVYNASLAASYEIDFWGKVKHGELAAQADQAGAVLQIQALAMTLSSTLADSWFMLVEQRAQKRLVEAQLETNAQLLELVQLRFDNGLADAVAVLQQREQMARTQAQLPLFDARIQVFENALAVLVRDIPGGDVATGETLPELPALPAVPVPGEVLAQRPDVAAALARIEATDHRIAVAIASRLPTLKLNGSIGLQAFELANFLESTIWNIGAQIGGLIWDGGRLDAEKDRIKAALREQIAAYASVTLTALKEVEDALVREQQQHLHLEFLDVQLGIARQLLEDSRVRYSEGVGDYLPVLTAVRTLQSLEQGRLSAQRQLISYRIALYRALGGDWQQVLANTQRVPLAQQNAAQAPKTQAPKTQGH